jgi:putative membrane protein
MAAPCVDRPDGQRVTAHMVPCSERRITMMWDNFALAVGVAGWVMVLLALVALFGLALTGVIIWGVVRLASGRAWRHHAVHAPPALSAEDIVRQRYARGEIDAQTYEAMRERLVSGEPSPEPTTPPV